MKTKFWFDFLWIPSDLGGRKGSPYSGMRWMIRWQQYIEDHLQLARDVQCQLVVFDSNTSRGRAVGTLITPVPTMEWLQEGQLIELLEVFHVIAVGKIITPPPQ
jgi:hypothetical protein